MAEKKSLPAPIDRPMAKAYLREFRGWSTAYPPGLSESNSLRTMHNVLVDADGSLRIRPGMRHILSTPFAGNIVGTFEHFYTTDGKKALLCAIRDTANGNRVIFRTAVYNSTTKLFDPDASIATRFPGATDSNLAFDSTTTYVKYVQIDNKILALSDSAESFRMFWVGSAPATKAITAVTRPNYDATDKPLVVHPTTSWISGAQVTVPAARAAAAGDLISSTTNLNEYNFAYFYSFNNEIGETMSSQIRVVKAQRRWSAWNVDASDETKSDDQLVTIVPQVAWDAAKAQGAVSWNLYFLTWSNQDSVPVEGVLIASTGMVGKTYAQAGWVSHTPFLQGLDALRPLPRAAIRDNFSIPSKASNGMVVGDRLILVYDRDNEARITWTSNLQGDYLNFSSTKGGGFKTLTSGNLYLPINVQLWQNPQSADTITVLCAGLDGYGNAYYMNPGSTVSNMSQSTVVMGFEETTATPGTTSPYGVEVLNNVLYHPLENNLMKSTASNYNINHASMSDAIQNIWHRVKLADKRKMVSSQMDAKLYYLVQSPTAWLPGAGHNGNQIWVCDTALSGVWSAWDVQGTSLKKVEVDGLLYMGVTSGRSMFVFDQEHDSDDVWEDGAWTTVGIAWEAITNTQGANRAHDAWATVQQANVTFGNFTGECVYGIRGKDVNGMEIEVSKHYISPEDTHNPLERFEQQDYLLVRRIMKEWEFFWRSAPRPKNRSYGSVAYVQYNYAPATINVGYEFGSIETLEYGLRTQNFSNAVPEPYADTRLP